MTVLTELRSKDTDLTRLNSREVGVFSGERKSRDSMATR